MASITSRSRCWTKVWASDLKRPEEQSGVLPKLREGDGEFFQIYTLAFDERVFFEIVERRSYHGFGAANAAIRLAAQTRESRPLAMPRS